MLQHPRKPWRQAIRRPAQPLGASPVGAHAVALASTAEQERWSRRSSMAAATIGSSKIWPQLTMARLVVRQIEPLR